MNNFSDVVRIGKDAVTRYTQGGKSVTGFSAAVDSGYGDNKQTIWLDCSAWGERWEKIAQYLIKGAQVMVNGELGTREHEGKTYITIKVADIRLIGKKPDAESKSKARPGKAQESVETQESFDDDIPF